jgi:hypothetical protein
MSLTRWGSGAIDWICCNRQHITEIAGKLGVSPEAIAGAMAKENHHYRTNPSSNQLLDHYAYGLNWSQAQWEAADVVGDSSLYDKMAKNNR